MSRALSRTRSVLDFTSDWAVLSFAVWTLIGWAGMATRAPATLLVWLWLPTLPLVGVALHVARRRTRGREGAERVEADAPDRRTPRLLVLGSVAGGLTCAALVVARSQQVQVPWGILWAPAAAAVIVLVVLGRLKSRPETDEPPRQPIGADVFAAATAFGLAVMSLFINNSDKDDAFYVNRATTTAQLNRIPVRDVLFTYEKVPPIGGSGTPVDTLHALQGAVGRFLGIHGASIAYYVTPPIATFLATWALWRLLRAWAPRRAVLCFAVGCQYWLWSAILDLNPGSFFLARIWQGKVIFVAWLVPTLYVLLTRWLSRRDTVTAVMLFAAGFASIGLTGSATLVAPLVFATAGLALLVRQEWRALAVVAGAAAVPFGIGFVVTRRYPLPHLFATGLHGNQWFFDHIFGVGVVGALGVAAVCIAPWIARAGPPARITTAIAVIALLLLAPGVLPGLSDALKLTDSLRRTLWIVPLPAMVGLLVALPVRWPVAAGAAAVVAAALIAFGQPVWQPRGDAPSYWTSRPEWKTNQARLGEARAILGQYHGSGSILASESVMLAIAIQTSHPKAVDARHYYARLSPEPLAWTRARRVLTEFATTGERVPGPSIEQALSVLGVGLVCVESDGVRQMRRLGLADRYRRAFRVDRMVCLRRA